MVCADKVRCRLGSLLVGGAAADEAQRSQHNNVKELNQLLLSKPHSQTSRGINESLYLLPLLHLPLLSSPRHCSHFSPWS